jgi:hypothetical protein
LFFQVEAVCIAIKDTVVLVQRVLLDFLLLAFPMHNSQLTKSDMSKIVKAVTNAGPISGLSNKLINIRNGFKMDDFPVRNELSLSTVDNLLFNAWTRRSLEYKWK